MKPKPKHTKPTIVYWPDGTLRSYRTAAYMNEMERLIAKVGKRKMMNQLLKQFGDQCA